MRYLLSIIILLSHFDNTSAQSLIYELFDSTHVQREWMGDTTLFSSKNNWLWLNAPSQAGVAQLSRPLQSKQKHTWDIKFELLFSPSESNKLLLFLDADSSNLILSKNGHYIQLGESGNSDAIQLIERINGVDTKIGRWFEGISASSTTTASVQIFSNEEGVWQVQINNDNINKFTTNGSPVLGSQTGFACVYTSTRSSAFGFDYFKVNGMGDIDTVTFPIYINEVLFDPSSNEHYPAEFIELFNPNDIPVTMNGWTISDATTTSIIPNTTLSPKSYLVLTEGKNTNLFPHNTLGITSFPRLNNDSDSITLTNPKKSRTHILYYHIDDLTDYKAAKSIELINPSNLCIGISNWKTSLDPKGATPGVQNSQFTNLKDTIPPTITRAYIDEKEVLKIETNEPIYKTSYFIIDNYVCEYQRSNAFECTSKNKNETNTYHIHGLNDCSNNIGDTTIIFERYSNILPNSILINEILFDPISGCPDFIELINTTSNTFDLSKVYWEYLKSDEWIKGSNITQHPTSLKGNEIIAFSNDTVGVKDCYPYFGKIRFSNIPSLPNNLGGIGVRNSEVNVDRLMYSSDWHSIFIDTEEGTSLERISGYAPTQLKDNWTSAATDIKATPGLPNSQEAGNNSQKKIFVEQSVISPNDDGYHDELILHINTAKNIKNASVLIYDTFGNAINTLAQNTVIGTNHIIRWNGTDNNQHKVSEQPYIVLIKLVDQTNKEEIVKIPVAVAYPQK